MSPVALRIARLLGKRHLLTRLMKEQRLVLVVCQSEAITTIASLPKTDVPSARYGSQYLGRGFAWLFMLPHPYHGPTQGLQTGISVPISRYVSEYLGSPPRGICLWPCTVHWARVPEAAVNEHTNSKAWKHHVHSSAAAWHSALDPVAQPQRSQLAAKVQLTRRVASPRRLHSLAHRRRRGVRSRRLPRHRTLCS